MVWLAGLMLGWLVPDLLAAGLADLLADLLAGWPERNQGLTWLAWVAGRARADLWSGLYFLNGVVNNKNVRLRV